MQGSALYNPRAHATPSQLRAHAKHQATKERIQEQAKSDSGIACLSASMRSALAPVVASTVTIEEPVRTAPLVIDYRSMWFYDLVFVTALREAEILAPYHPRLPRIDEIQRACGKHFGVKVLDIVSARRTAIIVRPRQVAMYLAKTLTMKSLPEIGRRFGGRDHTTVLHAVRKIEALTTKGDAVAVDIEAIKKKIVGGVG